MTPDILTQAGRYFNFEQPHASDFGIDEIAHALANLCRFTGHVNEFYSVAQHSVYVSFLVPEEHALAGLLHDAAEAFIGDVAAPLKRILPDYKTIEKRVEAAVLARFGLAPELPPEVRHADLVMLATERRDLMPYHESQWEIIQGIEPMAATVVPVHPRLAYRLFTARYIQLKGASNA